MNDFCFIRNKCANIKKNRSHTEENTNTGHFTTTILKSTQEKKINPCECLHSDINKYDFNACGNIRTMSRQNTINAEQLFN